MRNPIDAWLRHPRRMTSSESYVDENGLAVVRRISSEHHPPVSVGLREVGLHASGESCAVSSLLSALQELALTNAMLFEPFAPLPRNLPTSRRHVLNVLAERRLVKAHRKARIAFH